MKSHTSNTLLTAYSALATVAIGLIAYSVLTSRQDGKRKLTLVESVAKAGTKTGTSSAPTRIASK